MEDRGHEMTQPEMLDKTAAKREVAANGLFLVPSPQKGPLQVRPAREPALARPSRTLGLLGLAGAALAAPLLWLLHALYAALSTH